MYTAKNTSAWEAFELGALSAEEMLACFCKDRRAFDVAGLVRAIASRYAFLPGIEQLLDLLVGQGHVVHAMTNYPAWWEAVEERLRLSRFLQWSFVSCRSGSPRTIFTPSPRANPPMLGARAHSRYPAARRPRVLRHRGPAHRLHCRVPEPLFDQCPLTAFLPLQMRDLPQPRVSVIAGTALIRVALKKEGGLIRCARRHGLN
jgi:hypothetical protein